MRHGVFSREEADRALAVYRSRPADPGADSADAESGLRGVVRLLDAAKRYLSFDAETGTVPNRHDLLLQEFAQSSAGVFEPEAPLEDYVPDAPEAEAGKYTVQFIHGGKLYRFRPQDLGDWYDVAAVAAAVDRALADAGSAERFVLLASDGQIAEFIFARPDTLRAAAPELGLTIGDDPDAARKGGKAFEEEVIKSLRRGE